MASGSEAARLGVAEEHHEKAGPWKRLRRKASRQGGRCGFEDGRREALGEEKVRLTAGREVGVSAGSEGRVSQEWDQGSMGELESMYQWFACFYTWTSATVALKQVRGESGGLEEVKAEKVRLSAKIRRQTGALLCGPRRQKMATSAERYHKMTKVKKSKLEAVRRE